MRRSQTLRDAAMESFNSCNGCNSQSLVWIMTNSLYLLRNIIRRISTRRKSRASAKLKIASSLSVWWLRLTWSNQNHYSVQADSNVLTAFFSFLFSYADARRAVNIFTKAKNSTPERKMLTTKTTWEFEFIDFTSRYVSLHNLAIMH